MLGPFRKFAAMQCIPLIDHTSLNDNDSEESIRAFCDAALMAPQRCATIIVYPQFITQVYEILQKASNGRNCIRVGSVVNFPLGNDPLDKVIEDTRKVVEMGVDEIDMVVDYQKLLSNREEGLADTFKLVTNVKRFCVARTTNPHIQPLHAFPPVTLKVILETGKLQDAELIDTVATLLLEAGADFIKTSTGKVEVNATIDTSRIMLLALKRFLDKYPEKKGTVGFKAAGGLKTLDQAIEYVLLAQEILGASFIQKNFRFGASSLLKLFLKELQGDHGDKITGQY
ncbi:deoxyribose-phosphate aldolase [Cardiosporidium cionae]|uniref:Deoxyribose-phosphate aldolase n=1 Tax=Cardiosporidium cionae TaxID=476202 RepID=A0ABQ7J882_9APIC|nr:deoxyribose-phosphate aldolase [Cardiosporidium cionae]|eukprot:KAF8820196.1 deoxyribose-phosphate aldolase [Cardiosporidium cionae]